MHYFLSLATALLLFGCSGQTDNKEKSVRSETVQKTATEVKAEIPATTPEPTGLKKTVAPPLKQPVETAVDGASLYQKCVSCYGVKAEKSALGKSQIIAGWDSAKVEAALKGYQDGSYGGPMKALMQGQLKTFGEEQLKMLADHISKQ